MEKLYNIEDLLEEQILIDKYTKIMNYLRRETGGSSDIAIFRYCKQAGIKATLDGKIYRQII